MAAPSVFYLHGGPALGPVFERARYPDATHVHWWHQPLAKPCAARPYLDLQEATLTEFRRVAADAGQPLTVMASSFGAHLAVHLARHVPELIKNIVLLGPTFNPEQAALRLARRAFRVHTGHQHAGKLATALAMYEDDPGRPRFWDVFGALSLLPDVTELYFGPHGGPEAARSFAELIQQPGAFDGPTSVATSDDFSALDHTPVRSAFEGPVSVLFGAYDPMIDAEQDRAVWEVIFPQAAFFKVETGHFPLLELTLEACLSPA
ncbi:alpha/beta fold hydrolase [Duganella sp. sic0402]|uniref:alpha/beta fold hydrolase n=1 Tax=Duganella sp. sic0402 TaxID=2854786 RepID=UPI001E416CC8|nr:alpha/beta hydrolase [Duganella sp. sic0402]